MIFLFSNHSYISGSSLSKPFSIFQDLLFLNHSVYFRIFSFQTIQYISGSFFSIPALIKLIKIISVRYFLLDSSRYFWCRTACSCLGSLDVSPFFLSYKSLCRQILTRSKIPHPFSFFS